MSVVTSVIQVAVSLCALQFFDFCIFVTIQVKLPRRGDYRMWHAIAAVVTAEEAWILQFGGFTDYGHSLAATAVLSMGELFYIVHSCFLMITLQPLSGGCM